ncbi:MAG: DUF5678 domain-containing protein [Dehalococcoidia bacterium]
MPEHDEAAMLQHLGDPQRVADELREFRKDFSYLSSIYSRLVQEHPNQWVAVFGRQVVAIAETPEKLVALVEGAGVPTTRTVIERLLPADMVLVL